MEPHERFRALYAAHVDPLLGYALRRVTRPADAADVVSETFLTAWRRLPVVPEEPETRLWLYGAARRVLSNHRRGDRRRESLGARLRTDLESAVPDHALAVAERAWVRSALERLADRDREVLELSAWEELEPREIAVVLGISDVAVRSRLSRARSRLREVVAESGNDRGAGGHEQVDATLLDFRSTP